MIEQLSKDKQKVLSELARILELPENEHIQSISFSAIGSTKQIIIDIVPNYQQHVIKNKCNSTNC